MNAEERLSILLALEKRVKEELKAVRSEVDKSLLEQFSSSGVDRMRLRLGGSEVGKISVTETKAAVEPWPYVNDQRRAASFLVEEQPGYLLELLESSYTLLEAVAVEWLEHYGEEIPGVAVAEKVKPSRRYTRATVDVECVARILSESALPLSEVLELSADER